MGDLLNPSFVDALSLLREQGISCPHQSSTSDRVPFCLAPLLLLPALIAGNTGRVIPWTEPFERVTSLSSFHSLALRALSPANDSRSLTFVEVPA